MSRSKNCWLSSTDHTRPHATVPTDILRAYALIDAWSCGGSVIAPRNAPPPKPAVPMGKNDLWVAATAHASGAILLSTDRDFQQLDRVWLRYEHVDQTAKPG